MAQRRIATVARHVRASSSRAVDAAACAAASGGSVAEVAATPLADIAGSVARLRGAFASERTVPLQWRIDQLNALRRLVAENVEELTRAVHTDLGRSALQTELSELKCVQRECADAVAQLATWCRPEQFTMPLAYRPAEAMVRREPLGVVCVISPWNFPLVLCLSPLVGALAAGNCVVVKPSEVAPSCAAVLGRLLGRYMDPDCVAVVQGGVAETTELLRQRFDHIVYTGNAAVARIVMHAASEHLTPVTLELGGKSPAIVARDANVRVAARRIAWAKTLNAGQTCIAPDYVLVHEAVAKDFFAELVRALRDQMGPDPRASEAFGRIINERHCRRLAELLDEPESVRGTVLCGGDVDVAACYLAPTVLRGTSPDAKVMADEIFGPILPCLVVGSLSEAIDFVRARPKPLALYLFSSSVQAQEAVVARTSAGSTVVNDLIIQFAAHELPFGGVGPSGMGRYHGKHSFDTFSNPRTVVVRSASSWLDPSVRYAPYTDFKAWLLRKLM